MQDKHSSQIFTSIKQSEAPLHGIEVCMGTAILISLSLVSSYSIS